MKKYITIIIFTIGINLGLYQFLAGNEPEKIEIPEAVSYEEFQVEEAGIFYNDESEVEKDITTSTIEEEDEGQEIIVEEDKEEGQVLGEKILNKEINLAVPFTSQAPTANWDLPWNDACEEASFLMVDYYYQNKTIPDKKTTEQILFDMVAWQEENWHEHENLTLEDLKKYIEENFEYKAEIVEDLSIEKIKKYLDKGLPLIVPANGKKLENPYFRNGGPLYHMLVIKGYIDDKERFITNDPGTRMGENFIYTYEKLMESIADWNKKRSSATGPKRAIILYRD